MIKLPEDALKIPQQEVQRLLGRCLLQLQQYERLLKAITSNHELSGPAHALEAIRAKRIKSTASKTLGSLVNELLGSYVVGEDIADQDLPTTGPEIDLPSVSFRTTTQLSDADFVRMKSDLNELVAMRNNLVHHFIDAHDLWSVEGCRGAQDALVVAYNRITQNYDQLRALAEELDQSRRLMVEALKSGVVHNLVVHGVAPDGMVDWSYASVVSSLREAAHELAIDGWTPVTAAGSWVTERYPEQLPAKFGCSSWRQVVHEARVFELQYFEVDGQRSAWYREKGNSVNLR